MILLLCIGLTDANAQRNKYKRRKAKNRAMSNYTSRGGGRFRQFNFVSFNVNALNYYGDLAPVNRAASTDVSFTRPGFGAEIGARFNPYMAVRAGFNYGRLKGDDITSDYNDENAYGRYLRNLSFRNDIKEFHIGMQFSLLPIWGGPNVRPDFNVYAMIGAAVFHHEPKGKVPEYDHTLGGDVESNYTQYPVAQAGEWVRLRKLGTEGQLIDSLDVKGYSPFQFSVPLAIGATMRLPGPFNLSVELGYRYLFTDYLDDVSGSFVRYDLFDDDLARIMSDRSAEPTAVWQEVPRDGFPGAVGQQMPDGTTYYSARGYGGGLAGDKGRGNPDDNDMMFMTTVKLTMILGQVRRSAKFR